MADVPGHCDRARVARGNECFTRMARWRPRSRSLCDNRPAICRCKNLHQAVHRHRGPCAFHAAVSACRRGCSRPRPPGRVVVPDASRHSVAGKRYVPRVFDGARADSAATRRRIQAGCGAHASCRRRRLGLDARHQRSRHGHTRVAFHRHPRTSAAPLRHQQRPHALRAYPPRTP